MAVQNTHRSYLGIAKETTKGTAVQPTDFIPVTASKLKPVDSRYMVISYRVFPQQFSAFDRGFY